MCAYDIKFDKDAFFNPIKPVKIHVHEAIKEENWHIPIIRTQEPIHKDSNNNIFEILDQRRFSKIKALRS